MASSFALPHRNIIVLKYFWLGWLNCSLEHPEHHHAQNISKGAAYCAARLVRVRCGFVFRLDKDDCFVQSATKLSRSASFLFYFAHSRCILHSTVKWKPKLMHKFFRLVFAASTSLHIIVGHRPRFSCSLILNPVDPRYFSPTFFPPLPVSPALAGRCSTSPSITPAATTVAESEHKNFPFRSKATAVTFILVCINLDRGENI